MTSLRQFQIVLLSLSMLISCPPTLAAKTPTEPDQSITQTPLIHWNGTQKAPVYWVKRSDLPIVDILLHIDAGSLRDGNQPGTAALTGKLLLTATTDLDEQAFIDQVGALGIGMNIDVDRDFATLHLRTLSDPEYFQPAIQLMVNALKHPSFTHAVFERKRLTSIAALEEATQNPSIVAAREFAKQLYGDTPYGRPELGTKDSLKQLTLNDLERFFKQYYTAANTSISIVGDLSKSQARKTANLLLSSLPQGPKASPIKCFKQQARGKSIHIAFPSTQNTILYGQLGTTPTDRDHDALQLGNHILGGQSLSSRLYRQVRDQRGLAYVTGSRFNHQRANGQFVIYALTRGDRAQHSVKVIKQTLKAYLEHGPTQQELDDAKANLLGRFAVDLSSNMGILSAIDFVSSHHLPDNYLIRFAPTLSALTLKNVTTALNTHLHPENFNLISVGQQTSSTKIPPE